MPAPHSTSALMEVAATSGNLTLPTFTQADVDGGLIIIIKVHSKVLADVINLPTGFTALGSQIQLDATAPSDDSRAAWFWKRAVIGDSGATVAISRQGVATNLLQALAQLWGECKLTGDPFDTAGMSQGLDIDADDVVPWPAHDPVADSCHVIYDYIGTNDLSEALPTTLVNGGTTFNKRHETDTIVGQDGCFGCWSAERTGAALGALNQDLGLTTTMSDIAVIYALLPEPISNPETLVPNTTIAVNGWEDQLGGSTDLHSPLADALESTYIISPSTPAGATFKVGLAEGVGTLAVALVKIEIDIHQAGSGTASDFKLELREGGVLRAERPELVPVEDVADPGNRYEMELTDDERLAIVNWNNVEVWGSAGINGGTRPLQITRLRVIVYLVEPSRRGQLYWTEFEVPDEPAQLDRRGLLFWAELEVPNAPSAPGGPGTRSHRRRRRLSGGGQQNIPNTKISTEPSAAVQNGQQFAQRPVVQLQDGLGNNLAIAGVLVTVSVFPSGATLAFTASNPGVGGHALTDANGQASYTAMSLTGGAGSYHLTFTAIGYVASQSNLITLQPTGPSPANSTATVPSTIQEDQTVTILVQARDVNNNPLTVGGATVAVTVAGANPGSKTVVDNGDGTYSCSYVAATDGIDTITITMNTVGISGSPFALTVNPPVPARMRIGPYGQLSNKVGIGPDGNKTGAIWDIAGINPHLESNLNATIQYAIDHDIILFALVCGAPTAFGGGTADGFDFAKYKANLDYIHDNFPAFNDGVAAGRIWIYMGDEPGLVSKWNDTWTPLLVRDCARECKLRWPNGYVFLRWEPSKLAAGWAGQGEPATGYDAIDYLFMQYESKEVRVALTPAQALADERAVADAMISPCGVVISINLWAGGLQYDQLHGVDPCWDMRNDDSSYGVVAGVVQGLGLYAEGQKVNCATWISTWESVGQNKPSAIVSPEWLTAIINDLYDDPDLPAFLYWTWADGVASSMVEYQSRSDIIAAHEYAIGKAATRPFWNGMRPIKVWPIGAPTWAATAQSVQSGARFSPTMPPHEKDDILVCVGRSPNETMSLYDAQGFQEIPGAEAGTGVPGALGSTNGKLWWRRAPSSTTPPPVFDDFTSTTLASIHVLRGCVPSGNPWDGTPSVNVSDTEVTAVSIPAVVTSKPNRLIFMAVFNGIDAFGAHCSIPVNSNLTDIKEREDRNHGTGAGGGYAVFTGVKASAGSTGIGSAALDIASRQARIVVAFRKD